MFAATLYDDVVLIATTLEVNVAHLPLQIVVLAPVPACALILETGQV